eukprot:gnl/MRDRNA2_/MRDRNA2_97153_c0_seq1.p1 gnl/MRDRNA2_/MRDRNA2_97153_c0~~gnl/MRDRNA2_/MRDRNA2_97153_c0_seq1.p1  ORF type:complete len:1150 (+),score=184.93 gnl/MRDRNA2_/MRDRNA2_97153_c0_seq1:437-3451(+)
MEIASSASNSQTLGKIDGGNDALFQKMHNVRQSMVHLKSRLQEEISRGNSRRASVAPLNLLSSDDDRGAGSRRGSVSQHDQPAAGSRRTSIVNLVMPGMGSAQGSRRPSIAPTDDNSRRPSRRPSASGFTMTASGLMVPQASQNSRRPSFGGSRRASGTVVGPVSETFTFELGTGDDDEDDDDVGTVPSFSVTSSRRQSGASLGSGSRRPSMADKGSRRPSACISIKDSDDGGDGRTMFIQIGTVETIPDGPEQAGDGDSDGEDQPAVRSGPSIKKRDDDWKNPHRLTELGDPKKLPIRSMKEFLKREAALKANAMISNVKYIQQKLEETKDEVVELKTNIMQVGKRRERRGLDDADVEHILGELKGRTVKLKQKRSQQVRELLRKDMSGHSISREDKKTAVLHRHSFENEEDDDGVEKAIVSNFGPRGTLELPKPGATEAPRLSALALLGEGDDEKKKVGFASITVSDDTETTKSATLGPAQRSKKVLRSSTRGIPTFALNGNPEQLPRGDLSLNFGEHSKRRGTAIQGFKFGGPVKKKNLPEVPRLRSKFRGKRLILNGQYRDGKMTTKRWHERVAEELGLTDEDWNSKTVYAICENDLDDIARDKEECERITATTTLQIWWRYLRLKSYLANLNQLMTDAATLLQRWWLQYLMYKLPIRKRVQHRQEKRRAATLIQTRFRGWRAVRYWWSSMQVARIGDHMNVLQAEMKMPTIAEIVKMQSLVRRCLARKHVRRLRELKREKTELARATPTVNTDEVEESQAELEKRMRQRRCSWSIEGLKRQGRSTYRNSQKDRRNSDALEFRKFADAARAGNVSSIPGQRSSVQKRQNQSLRFSEMESSLVESHEEEDEEDEAKPCEMLLGREVSMWCKSGKMLAEASLAPLLSAGQLAAANPISKKRKLPITVTRAKMYGLPQISEILGNDQGDVQSDEEEKSAELSKAVAKVRGLQRQPRVPAFMIKEKIKENVSRPDYARGTPAPGAGPAPRGTQALKLGSLSRAL